MTEPAVAAPPASVTDTNLPEGVSLKSDYKTDIDKYFDGPEGNKAESVAKPAAVAPKVPEAPAPKPVGLAAKLATKLAPPVKAPEAAPPPAAVEDPVSKIEAEMRAHNPKWKPAEGWEKLKSTLKSEAEKRAQLEKDLAAEREKVKNAPTGLPVTVQELEALRAREKELSDRMMVHDLENHPTFKAQYIEPKNAEVARANEILKSHNVNADVASLLSKPRSELGKAVSEILKDVPEFDRVEVAESIRKAYSMEQNARQAIGKSKEIYQGLQQQTVERQRSAFASRWAPVSAAIGEHIVEIEVPVTATAEERASIEDYNNSFKNLRSQAEKIALAPASEESVADAAIKAAAYDFHVQKAMPRILHEFEQVVQENRQLTEELRALRGRNPNLHIRGTAVADGPESDPARMDHRSAAEHYFSKAD